MATMNNSNDDDMSEGCPPPTRLHQLAYNSNWNGVLKRLEECPEEGSQTVNHTTWMKQDGECLPEDDLIIEATHLTPMHILCTRRDVPVNVLDAYVRAQPEAIRLLTNDKRAPIHLACYAKQSFEVIQFLAEADPDTLLLQETFDGWNVFHICVHCDTEENVMSMMLNVAGPSRTASALAMQDRRHRIPVVLACNVRPKITKADFALLFQESSTENLERSLLEEISRNYRSYISSALKLKPPPKSPVANGDPSPYCSPTKSISVEGFWLWRPMDSLALWRCMHKMLVVLGAARDSDLATYPLLHECIRQDPHCKTYFFHCILSLNPHYAYQMDTNGDLPLHVAVRRADNSREWQNRIAGLVISYPKGASIANREGELALELLDKKHVSWDHMRSLLRCCPVALSRLHLHESCYAEVLAKLEKKSYTSTMFAILKETPSLFER